jgi:DNA-binding NtrC family response regulator
MLLSLRSAVLRKNGYTVLEARNIEQVFRMDSFENIRVAVLCHTIPASERQKLISAIQRSHPHAVVLALHTGWQRVEEADESIESLSGPQTLLDCIESAIRNKKVAPEKSRLRQCG